jgi:hypothetical protein
MLRSVLRIRTIYDPFRYLFILDGVEVNLADPVNGVLVLEGNESEPSVTLRLLVHEHHSLLHLAYTKKMNFALRFSRPNGLIILCCAAKPTAPC